ncbi:hypothetical protein BJ875DRAFT_468946 [Amylocarpus encephaloides]|uniref:NAD-dependent epimerase/dehydratase domain-containing protein n=1 Tax=Amylocarpus encephaloides TaxID=45428 RepID=A0A9P7YEN2_9HELO|nr:hypothetical protein BJ875DRAFT_468946 [Amylocarpus encephaloides]
MTIAASNGKTVLITGINGYIASVLGQLVLTKGYSLRGTTRRPASVDALLNGAYAPYADRVDIFEVPDMTVPGAFDEAVKGVDGIFHTASPINFNLTTYEETVDIAVAGNTSLLDSALKAGPQLKSVVTTSSTVSVMDPKEEGSEYVFTEKDFASLALEESTKDRDAGRSTPSNRLYAASKTAADRTMWKFRDEKKPSFAISSINPVVVVGPPAALAANPRDLNETLYPLYTVFSGSSPSLPADIGSASSVDVRDVAFAHLWALEHPSIADGERYIACSGKGTLQAAADTLRYAYKGTSPADRVIKGTPGKGYVGYDEKTGKVSNIKYPPGQVRVDGSKAERVMGFRYIPYEKSVADTAKIMERYFENV